MEISQYDTQTKMPSKQEMKYPESLSKVFSCESAESNQPNSTKVSVRNAAEVRIYLLN